jgi:hypothetical protein
VGIEPAVRPALDDEVEPDEEEELDEDASSDVVDVGTVLVTEESSVAVGPLGAAA